MTNKLLIFKCDFFFIFLVSSFCAKIRQVMNSSPANYKTFYDYKNILSSKLNAVFVFATRAAVASSTVGSLMLLLPVGILRLCLVVENA